MADALKPYVSAVADLFFPQRCVGCARPSRMGGSQSTKRRGVTLPGFAGGEQARFFNDSDLKG
jgi:hypothetical protein